MTILCYHAVEEGWDSPLAVTPQAFDRQCAWLARNRRVVGLDVALDAIGRTGRLPRRTTALTFDDGFASVYEHAFPILQRHGLPATVFLVAETLTPAGRAVDWVDTPPSYPMRTMTRDQVLEMHDVGFGFESHSHSHHDLTTLDEQACVDDLARSRDVLEDLLDVPVRVLAYPRGRHDDRVRRATEQAGFTYGLALPEAPEPTGPFAVPRAGVYPGNGTRALALKTQPWYVPVRASPVFPFLRRIAGRGPARSRDSG